MAKPLFDGCTGHPGQDWARLRREHRTSEALRTSRTLNYFLALVDLSHCKLLWDGEMARQPPEYPRRSVLVRLGRRISKLERAEKLKAAWKPKLQTNGRPKLPDPIQRTAA